MPLYEYECPTHGHMEVQQRITEDALKICPVDQCGQPVRKLISNTSFALKGSGWYATDYGGGTKASAKSESKSDAKPEGAPEKKAEPGGCGSPACATGCAGAAAA
jgi:putative FmdB family regulatory protein